MIHFKQRHSEISPNKNACSEVTTVFKRELIFFVFFKSFKTIFSLIGPQADVVYKSQCPFVCTSQKPSFLVDWRHVVKDDQRAISLIMAKQKMFFLWKDWMMFWVLSFFFGLLGLNKPAYFSQWESYQGEGLHITLVNPTKTA